MNNIKKEFEGLFYKKGLITSSTSEDILQWIEQKLIEERIKENERNIDLFIHHPETEFKDLDIQAILKNRIKQLEGEK